MTWQRELDLATAATRAASRLLVTSFAADAGVLSHEGKDIKTRADSASEALIVQMLAPSGMPVFGEESVQEVQRPPGLHWIVDPLDGTMNFSRGFPIYAVSIALWQGDTPVLGVVADIARETLFSGIVGAGAWRDGLPIRVSSVCTPAQAVLATGFPTGCDYGTDSLSAFVQRVQAFKKVRMIGSAVLSLAMVAQGTFDAYFEEDIMIWDVAAGLALVAAAGGRISARPGRNPLSVVAAATNGFITV